MFIAVVMQLRGFAFGVILTTQMSSIVPPVLVFAGFASALLLSKPGAPITFSSTNRYLSILPARKMSLRVEVIRWLGAALNRTTRLPTYRATCRRLEVGGNKWFLFRHLVEEGSCDWFRVSPFRCVRRRRSI